MKTAIILLALTVPALAQQQTSNDENYWLRYLATKEAQCGQQTVQLMKSLDAANKKIEELQQQLMAHAPAKPEK